MNYEPHTFRNFAKISLSVLVFCVGMPAFAQTEADLQEAARQAEQLQRQVREQLQRDVESAIPPERAPSGIDTRSLLPKIDASAAGAGCREIREIVISGAPNLSDTVREQITRTFVGRCLGVNEIEQILAEVTQYYIKRGLITTRAYLPQQDLSSGTLKILVLEGVVGKIIIEDGGRHSIAGNAFPSSAGDILNLRALEQGIDQVNKLSSNKARLDIQPGEKPGESVVVIHNTPGVPFHASLSADNHGSKSTGKNQVGVTLIADRLLGLDELLLFTHRRSQPNDLARQFSGSNSLSLAVPFGFNTLSLSFSNSKYVSTLHTPSGLDLKSNGTSSSKSLGLDRVLYRDQTTRWSLAGALVAKSSKNFLAEQFLSVSSRDLTTLDIDTSLTTFVLGGTATLGLGYSNGLRLAGALEDPDGLPESAPRAQFRKYKYSFHFARPFQLGGTHFTVSSSYTGQHALTTLYGSEQIGVGGNSSVRGFVNNSLSGDDGYYIRNEISAHPNLSIGDHRLPLRIFAGIDVGSVRSRAAGVPGGRLTGMAIGISTAFKGASIEIFTGRPLHAPSFFKLEPSQTWIRIGYAI